MKIEYDSTKAYLAGLFDGEGYLGLYASGLICGIEMCQKQALCLFVDTFGGTVRIVPSRGNRKQGYRISYRGQNVVAILRALRPWIKVKADLVDLALLAYESWKGGCKEFRQAVLEDYRDKAAKLGFGKPSATGHRKGQRNRNNVVVKKGLGGKQPLL